MVSLKADKYGNLVPSLAERWTVSKDDWPNTYKPWGEMVLTSVDGEEYAECDC